MSLRSFASHAHTSAPLHLSGSKLSKSPTNTRHAALAHSHFSLHSFPVCTLSHSLAAHHAARIHMSYTPRAYHFPQASTPRCAPPLFLFTRSCDQSVYACMSLLHCRFTNCRRACMTLLLIRCSFLTLCYAFLLAILQPSPASAARMSFLLLLIAAVLDDQVSQVRVILSFFVSVVLLSFISAILSLFTSVILSLFVSVVLSLFISGHMSHTQPSLIQQASMINGMRTQNSVAVNELVFVLTCAHFSDDQNVNHKASLSSATPPF